jgi:LPXTG-site transpeptidase (sortase) family protein
MGESGRCEGLAGSVASGGRAEPASIQAAALDATGNPSWGQVLVTTVRLWLSRRMPRVSIERPDRAASLAAADRAAAGYGPRTAGDAAGHGPRTAGDAAAGSPSWGQVLATTIRLWLSRRMPRVSIEWQHRDWPGASQAPRPARALRRPAGRGVRRSAGAPRPRGSYRRVLAASLLGLGLLAVGAGTAGVVVASRSAGPEVRLPARPKPVPAPTGRTVTPVWLTTVQRTAEPVSLTIPAIGVRTKLVHLGLNSNGTLQVPASTAVAGWYTGSPRPGATGAAVIAGHVDSRTAVGVFYWLRTLRPGDRVYVKRADGTLAVFTVTSVRTYAKDQFPTAAVYGPVPDAELRLITCGGTFDWSTGHYLSNVVVSARLTG